MTKQKYTQFDESMNLKSKEFDEVATLLADVDDARGILNKVADDGRKWGRCFSFAPGEYTEEQLLDLAMSDYGPGEYPVQFKTKNENNKNVVRWQHHFNVQTRRSGAAKPEPAAAPAPTSSNDAIVLALENQSRILEKLSDYIARPPPEPAEQKSTFDFIKELGAVKDLFTDNKQGALETFKDAMELRKLISDDLGDGPSDPLTAAIKMLAPAIEKGATALQEKEAAADTGAQRARPAPAEPPAHPAQFSPVDELDADKDTIDAKARPLNDAELTAARGNAGGDPRLMDLFVNDAYRYFAQSYLPAAMQLATTNQDPESTAQWLARLIEHQDDKARDAIGLVVSQDDMVERFAKFDPGVMNYAAWFDDVADWLAHTLWPDQNPAPGAEETQPAPVANATKSATIEAEAEASAINGGETAVVDTSTADIATGEPLPNAENPDLSTTGDDNDA